MSRACAARFWVTFAVAASLALSIVCAPVAAAPTSYGSLKHVFYVALEGSASTATNDIVAVASSQEFAKLLVNAFPPPDPSDTNQVFASAAAPWVVPLTSGGSAAIAEHCANDPQTIGGVVLTYYSGYATHYYLLWQSETTTFDLTATLIKCTASKSHPQSSGLDSSSASSTLSTTALPNPTATAAAGSGAPFGEPTIVGVITQLPGAGDTPWVVRRSQFSIPLLTFASLTTLLSPKTTAKTNNITLTALAGSLFGGASSKDVPGYSDPVRLRAAARHIADDIVGATAVLCKTTYDVAPDQYEQRKAFCESLGFKTVDVTAPHAP